MEKIDFYLLLIAVVLAFAIMATDMISAQPTVTQVPMVHKPHYVPYGTTAVKVYVVEPATTQVKVTVV